MLDDRDRKLLDILQSDAGLPVTELAERVALSVSACSRRIQRLEAEGYITGRRAALDPGKIGLPTTVFALIKTSRHSDDWVEAFHKAIARIPEIVEAHRLTGNYDYILKIALPSVEYYDVIYKQIIRQVELFDMSASISMEALKQSGALPVSHAV
jgi:Lrp/AsnC family transcriptional regulator